MEVNEEVKMYMRASEDILKLITKFGGPELQGNWWNSGKLMNSDNVGQWATDCRSLTERIETMKAKVLDGNFRLGELVETFQSADYLLSKYSRNIEINKVKAGMVRW